MTKDEVEAALAKLTRYDDGGDFEGGYMMHKRQNGMYVEFHDVRELLESIESPPESAALLTRIQQLEERAAQAAELVAKAVEVITQKDRE